MERGVDVWQLAHDQAHEYLRRFADPWTRSHRDDLVQETAMAAWKWVGEARDPARFWAAVRTIARRIRYRGMVNAGRERAMRRHFSGAGIVSVSGSVVGGDTYLWVGGIRVPAHRVLPCVQKAMGRLRPLDRQLLLDFHSGFCCAELSARSNRSEQCVKTRLHRARRRVQSDVEDCVRVADGLDE